MKASDPSSIQADRDNLLQYLDKTPVGLCIFSGPENTYVMVNEQYVQLMGNRDYIGHPAGVVVPELSDQSFCKIIKNVYKTGKAFSEKEIPATFIHSDGIERTSYFDINFQPILGADGSVSSVLQVSIDVTESVAAKQAMAESVVRMKKLADNMPQIVWKADSEGNTYYVNNRWLAYSGFDDFVDWKNFIHPDDQGRARSKWKESILTGKPYEAELRLKRLDGVFEWHLTRANADFSSEGKIIRWYGTCTNIEEQKVLAHELSMAHLTVESERQKFETLFHSSPAAMAILKGPNLIFERANAEYLKLVNNRDIIGKTLTEALPELTKYPDYLKNMQEVFRTGIPYTAKEKKNNSHKFRVTRTYLYRRCL